MSVAVATPVHLIRMHSGRTVMDVYKAPDLGCHGLRAVLWRSPDEPLEMMAVENLQLGDPDPALFEIPAGYRISRFTLK